MEKQQAYAQLEEAADEYEKKHTYQRYDGGGLTPEYDATLAEAVIFGAKWYREQMMKEAVDGEVIIYGGLWQFYAPDLDIVLRKLDEGDKVKIIIVKE